MGIRALCTDIDGTLLDIHRELSPQTISAIGKIKTFMPVVLASSRMPSAMRHLQKQLDILSHPLICYNGGYVVQFDDNDSRNVIYSTDISLDTCCEILALGNRTSLHLSLYKDDQWYAPKFDQWAIREATITKVSPLIMPNEEVLKLWKETKTGAHKIMCMGDAPEITELESILQSKFSKDVHVYHSKSTYLEIAPKVISKASALKLLLKKLYNLGLENVIAFGDNYNDVELLQSAGLGIAVDNAREEVKAVAKEITSSSAHDGVAHAICKHLLNGFLE